MESHYQILGLELGASPDEIKAAYHAKLREFPAHTHPQGFKAVRAAYEALRKTGASAYEDLFTVRPFQVEIDPVSLDKLYDRALTVLEVSLDDLIRTTF